MFVYSSKSSSSFAKTLLSVVLKDIMTTKELFEDFESLNGLMYDQERTFISTNSTYIAYGVAAGAALILILAVGLYLYDYYYGTSSRSDPVDYSQYYSDQEAYNQYLYQLQQQQQNGQQQTNFR